MERLNGGYPSPRLIDVSALLVFALIARFLFYNYWLNLPLGGDEKYYWHMARTIATKEFVPELLFLRPPVWSYLLSAAAAMSPDPAYGRILTTIIGAGAAPLVYAVGHLLFDRRVGITAGIICAWYPNYIGYSHYLWAEPISLVIFLASTYFFFRAFYEKSVVLLYVSVLIMGVGLLTKESAVILFVAFMITLACAESAFSKRHIPMCALIFILPALLYGTYATVRAGRLVLLADAPFYNINQLLHKSDPWKWSPAENRRVFFKDLMNRKIRELPRSFGPQLCNLWNPSSFTIHRLLHLPNPKRAGAVYLGSYNAPHARFIAYIAAGCYIVIVMVGVTGMLLSESAPFRTFGVSSLLLLSLSSGVFLMATRFRAPFMYICILYASAFFCNPMKYLEKGPAPRAFVVWAACITLFVCICVIKWPYLGWWG